MSPENQKLKLLYLARILEQETDDEHGLTTPQLIERLAEKGIEVERKTLYRDLQCLMKFGYDIQKYERHPVEYGLASREFQQEELMLMADAVQSSKFLTEKKADRIVSLIGKLGSKAASQTLEKRIHVEGRIKSQNESVFYNLDAIQKALVLKRKINFKYVKKGFYDKPLEELHVHQETPVQLTYIDDFYYLIVWNDKHQGFANYRVDRMYRIQVAELPATANQQIKDFDIGTYQERVFGMFSGKVVHVTLRVNAKVMSAVVDRFGKGAIVNHLSADGSSGQVHVSVMEAPTFYGWLATFGTEMEIISPEQTRNKYRQYLLDIAHQYER